MPDDIQKSIKMQTLSMRAEVTEGSFVSKAEFEKKNNWQY